jgi:kinetochore protein Spc7/SPC105
MSSRQTQTPISIDDFFELTGIKFMDGMTVPRRSSVHPSQLRRRRSSTIREAPNESPADALADRFLALALHVPQLEVHAAAARDLQNWIDGTKTHFMQANEEALKLPPVMFEEYRAGDEEDRDYLLVSGHSTSKMPY